MNLTVNERARSIATFRFIQVRMMETLAVWTPTTPEMEIKVLFGRHIWDLAQHADALGRRTFELRQPMHYTLEPAMPYLELLDGIRKETDSSARLSYFYEMLLPTLEVRYRDYLSRTDELLDQPSVVVIERILADFTRMRVDTEKVRSAQDLSMVEPVELIQREKAIASIVAQG